MGTLFVVAYILGVGLALLGAWLVFDRTQFAWDNARWHRTKMPDSSDPKVQRLRSFGFGLFGVLFLAVGLYVIALAAKIAP